MEEVLRTPEAARFVGLSPSTLEKLRRTGGGPKFIKLARRVVVYRVEDLRAWLTEREAAQPRKDLAPRPDNGARG